ncbi:MAG: response regulator transcription factor [Polaromonas sp.]|nr:response regulator transcription factor [Polaromonas sp.]
MLFIHETAQEAQIDSSAPSREGAGLTVLIADTQHLVRGGLKLCLKAIDPHLCVLESETLASAVDTYRGSPRVDLVLLDQCMPGVNGESALDGFARDCPDARIVLVSASYEMKAVQAALCKGVRGFIPKLAGRDAFINALRLVLGGGIYIPPEALMASSDAMPPTATPPSNKEWTVSPPVRSIATLRSKLTTRQIEVLAQLLEGKPNKQICRELNLALGTVKCHVGAILGALEVNSRAEAIAAADRRGWREWLAQPRAQGGNASHAGRHDWIKASDSAIRSDLYPSRVTDHLINLSTGKQGLTQ